MKESLLAVRDLSIHFGGLKAVDGVDFHLDPGEILGLLGPNGAGKTTCFNMISGVYRPTRGEIRFQGARTDGLAPHQMAALGIGRTFQIVKPFATLSVRENVCIALGGNRYRGNLLGSFRFWRRPSVLEEAERILRDVGLGDRMDQRAGLLPIGNLRKLEIARSLALHPKLLLLDESFSGLRHEEIEQIEVLVRRIREQGISILLIEHNMKVAMSICNQMVVINYGQKIAEGKPIDIAQNKGVIGAYLGEEYKC